MATTADYKAPIEAVWRPADVVAAGGPRALDKLGEPTQWGSLKIAHFGAPLGRGLRRRHLRMRPEPLGPAKADPIMSRRGRRPGRDPTGRPTYRL